MVGRAHPTKGPPASGANRPDPRSTLGQARVRGAPSGRIRPIAPPSPRECPISLIMGSRLGARVLQPYPHADFYVLGNLRNDVFPTVGAQGNLAFLSSVVPLNWARSPG